MKQLRLWRRDIGGGVEVWDVEEYLAYVVAHEVSSLSWPAEALRAQAIAARTYAYYHIEHPKHSPEADLCTETDCQYFRPGTSLPALSAVSDTSQVVLISGGSVINAEYHACCGGTIKGCPCRCARNGHGRGMCQQGAKELALAGKTYKQILEFYYPGTELRGEEMDKEKATLFLFERFGQHFPADIQKIVYMPSFALARAARQARLGPPVTNEHTAMFGAVTLVYQFYLGGMAWCVKPNWNEVNIERW